MYPGVHSRILTLYAISGCISTFVILITECKLKKQTLSGALFLMYLITSLLLASTDIKNYPSSPNTSKVKIPLILPCHGSGQRDAGENLLLQFYVWKSRAEKSLLIISFIPEVFHSAKSGEEKQATEFPQPCLSEHQ